MVLPICIIQELWGYTDLYLILKESLGSQAVGSRVRFLVTFKMKCRFQWRSQDIVDIRIVRNLRKIVYKEYS